MKYILFLTIAFLLAHSSVSNAQVPGYQGKRFFIELGGTFFFNLNSPTAQNKGPHSFPFGSHTGHFTIKDRYSVALHYVIGRKKTFKLAYNYQISGLYTTATTRSLFQQTNSNLQDYHDLFYQLHSHDVNIGFNLYGKSAANLAPLGFYWDLGLRFVFVNGVLRDQRVKYADNRPDNTPYPDQLLALTHEPFTFMVGITAIWGYRTVIADRITLNFGLDMTLFPQYLLVAAPGGISPLSILGSSNNEKLPEYHKGVIRSIQERYSLGIHIGIGTLIF